MRYFFSFLFRNKETVSKNNCLGYWNISRIPHSQYVCYRSKKVKSLSKSYFLNIRPWWELHWFLQVMSPPICSSQTPPFIIIMLGLLYCGESFSIINMIRFVIISSSDEQACKLLHPKNVLHVHTSNKTKRELNQSYFEHVLLAWMMQKAKSPPVPTAPKTALLVFPTPSAEVSYFSEFEKNKCVNRRKHWLAFVGLFSYSAENKWIESKKIFFTYFVYKLLPFSDRKQTYCGWGFLLLFPWI